MHKGQSGDFSSRGQGFPIKFLKHICHACIGVVVARAKSRCLSLNSFQLLNILLVVGIPCGTCIFEGRADQSLVRRFSYRTWTVDSDELLMSLRNYSDQEILSVPTGDTLNKQIKHRLLRNPTCCLYTKSHARVKLSFRLPRVTRGLCI